MDSLFTSVVAAKAQGGNNPLDEFFGTGEDPQKKPKVDVSVAKAEVEAAAQADRDARAATQERRKTEHDTRAAALRQKYNLKEPEPDKPKKGLLERVKSAPQTGKGPADDAGDRRQSEAAAPAQPKKEKWYQKLFK